MIRISLGDLVRDRLSGVEGIATARSEYMTGCVRVLIEPVKPKDGNMVEWWIDEQRLEIVSALDFQMKKQAVAEAPAGPQSTPPSRDPR